MKQSPSLTIPDARITVGLRHQISHYLHIAHPVNSFSNNSTMGYDYTDYTVESPIKGHFGANSFVPCREVVSISEVNKVLAWCHNKCPL